MFKSFKQVYKKLSIRQKLLLLFSVQIIIPLVFMGLLLFKNTESIIENKSINYLADLLKVVELRVGDLSKEVTGITEDVLYDSNIYTLLGSSISEEEEESLSEYCYNFLRRICLGNDILQSITLVTLDNHVYMYDLHGGSATIVSTLLLEELVEVAKEVGGGPSWYVVPDESGAAKQLFLLRMIYSNEDFSERGVIALEIKKDKLQEVYNDFSAEFIQGIAILAADNTWVSGEENYFLNEEISNWVAMQEDKWNYEINNKTGQLLAINQTLSGEWKIVAVGNIGNLVDTEMNHFRILFFLIMLCTICILSILSILMAMDIIDPIRRLVEGMNRVEKDKVYEAVPVDREDE